MSVLIPFVRTKSQQPAISEGGCCSVDDQSGSITLLQKTKEREKGFDEESVTPALILIISFALAIFPNTRY